MQKAKIVSALALALLPVPALATLEVSEVMYDPSGTDSGREWVEVRNASASSVDLTKWTLLESEVNHRIAAHGAGPVTLAPGERAIVADKPDLFLLDYPDVGPVFDSAFSLSNSGERIALVSPEGAEMSAAEWSAGSDATDGRSWQRSGVAWLAALPTPGQENADRESAPAATSTPTSSGSSSSGGSQVSAHSGTGGLTKVTRQPEIRVDAGRSRVVPAGVELLVEPAVEGASHIGYAWSWGDGSSSKGKKGRHAYRSPGTYVVVLNARGSNGAAATSRTLVEVIEARVAVEAIADEDGGAVRLASGSNRELNLGGFELEAGGESLDLAPDTILLPGGEVVVPAGRLGEAIALGAEVRLRRPDGKIVRAL
jgi:hypothetical protein